MRRLTVVVLGALVALAAAPAAATTGFTPKKLAGTWTGMWNNQTFGSSGPLKIIVKAPASGALKIAIDLSGNAFGCQAPAPEAITLRKGKTPSGWNRRGFTLVRSSPGFGQVNAKFVFLTHKLTATGRDPACAPGVSWTFSGTWGSRKLTGTAQITLPNNQTATSTISLTRT